MLEDSLGGNCKTTMMAMISPAIEAMVESMSTLKFANRAKNIKYVFAFVSIFYLLKCLRSIFAEMKRA